MRCGSKPGRGWARPGPRPAWHGAVWCANKCSLPTPSARMLLKCPLGLIKKKVLYCTALGNTGICSSALLLLTHQAGARCQHDKHCTRLQTWALHVYCWAGAAQEIVSLVCKRCAVHEYRSASTNDSGLKAGCLPDSAKRSTCDAWRLENERWLALFLQAAREQQQQQTGGGWDHSPLLTVTSKDKT
jgi:hypothetical protein